MGNKQWRKQIRYHCHLSSKGAATAVSREVQTDPVYICDSDPSLLHGWNDNAFFKNNTICKSSNSFDLDMDQLQMDVHDRPGQYTSCSAVNKWDARERYVLEASEDDGRKKSDLENSQSYWGDTSSAELDEFLVAENLCNERDANDSEFALDDTIDGLPDLGHWSSDRKLDKEADVKLCVREKKDKPRVRKDAAPRHLRASAIGRPGISHEKNLQYTFYVDDVEQVKKPFYDRRICALINIDGCTVNLLDREANDKKRTYYKGTPVRPVVISAPSMSALRRCLGRIDTQFPHFNAKAFLRE